MARSGQHRAVAAAAVVPALALKAAVGFPPLGRLAAAAPMYAAAYLLLLFSSDLVGEDEQQAVREHFQPAVRRRASGRLR